MMMYILRQGFKGLGISFFYICKQNIDLFISKSIGYGIVNIHPYFKVKVILHYI
jgi:hypothetical protein